MLIPSNRKRVVSLRGWFIIRIFPQQENCLLCSGTSSRNMKHSINIIATHFSKYYEPSTLLVQDWSIFQWRRMVKFNGARLRLDLMNEIKKLSCHHVGGGIQKTSHRKYNFSTNWKKSFVWKSKRCVKIPLSLLQFLCNLKKGGWYSELLP